MDHLTYVFVLPQFFTQFISAAQELTGKIRNKSQQKALCSNELTTALTLLVIVIELKN